MCWLPSAFPAGHVEKRRKINHLAVKKAEQYLNRMHKDSIKLQLKRMLALEEQALQKLSEMSSALPTLASCIMNTEISKAVPASRRIILKLGLLGPLLIWGDPNMCRVGTPRNTFSYLNGAVPFLKGEGLHQTWLWSAVHSVWYK